MRKRSKQHSFFSFPSSRRGMELAIGTLVVMILGIIIVGGGILFVKLITDKSVVLNDNLNANVQRQLQDATLRGQLVGVAPSSQISYGAKDTVFGVRVVNKDSTSAIEFNIEVTTANPDDAANWTTQNFDKLNVPANDRKDAMIVVGAKQNIQVPPGTYTFIVKVKSPSGEVYDAPRFFTVLVK